MATWQQTSIIMLKTMLNDIGCGEAKYSSTRLELLLITAAYFVLVDIDFDTTYTVNIENQSITPEPIDQTDGMELISFMVLKAACMADESGFRTAALMQGVTARCGPAVLETSNYGQYLKELLLNGPCKTYIDLKKSYEYNYADRGIIKAIMSPFASNNFDPGMYGNGNGAVDQQDPHRGRFYY